MFTVAPRLSSTPMMLLPDELLGEIAKHVPARHVSSKYVVEVKSLSALSSVSRKLRAITLPYLFSEVAITDKKQLHALSEAPTDLLALARELNIFLDAKFLYAFKYMMKTVMSLGKTLAHTPALEALRIRVAEFSGACSCSSWGRSSLLRVDEIPIGNALSRTLPPSSELNHLATLELDVFSNIAPLLRITPNLQTLRLALPSGYAQHTNVQLLEALKSVPGLRELVYSPKSLRVTSTGHDMEAALVDDAEFESELLLDLSANLVEAIGKTLPCLEVLDLQTRWYGEEEITFPSSTDSITPEAFIKASKYLSNIKQLSLPNPVLSAKDLAVLRLAADDNDREAAAGREQALSHASLAEKSSVLHLGSIADNLSSVSFVRPVSISSETDSSIIYSVSVIPEHVVYLGRNAPPITRQRKVELVLPVLVRDAAAGHIDALPVPVGISRFDEWRRDEIWYAEETHFAAIRAAVAAGGVWVG